MDKFAPIAKWYFIQFKHVIKHLLFALHNIILMLKISLALNALKIATIVLIRLTAPRVIPLISLKMGNARAANNMVNIALLVTKLNAYNA